MAARTLDVGVFDVTGREVDVLRLTGNGAAAQTAPLASGMYFVRALEPGGPASVRAVVLN